MEVFLQDFCYPPFPPHTRSRDLFFFPFLFFLKFQVAFKVYDMDGDGLISNGELFQVLKMMVGENLTDVQLQQIVDKTILEGDDDKDGKISYEEFKKMITNIDDIEEKMTISFSD
eukprot:TRINITY_DN1872_c0_g1_i17.p1 TRINITY_DN1872_c0_g1~~TRINITY_DN1872_c0_g1_i17.p1  ORF type:complete len:115 (-),score=33.35 TRINITY_DN1872_c0_g1_i17:38-382(-)